MEAPKGFSRAIEAVFPQAQVQTCIADLVRASLNCVSWKERKQVAAALGAGDPVLRLPCRDPGDLHHQRHREPEHRSVQGAQAAGGFPSEEAALKGMYLALRNAIGKRQKPFFS